MPNESDLSEVEALILDLTRTTHRLMDLDQGGHALAALVLYVAGEGLDYAGLAACLADYQRQFDEHNAAAAAELGEVDLDVDACLADWHARQHGDVDPVVH